MILLRFLTFSVLAVAGETGAPPPAAPLVCRRSYSTRCYRSELPTEEFKPYLILKQPEREVIAPVVTPRGPTISSFLINGGATTTSSREVT